MRSRKPIESLNKYAELVKRSHSWQIVLLTKFKVFFAASWRDVDDAGALNLAYLLPSDDTVTGDGSKLLLSWKLIEWTVVDPADHVFSHQFSRHLVAFSGKNAI